MRIETGFDKCILCMNAPAESWEHLIPEYIGGRLEANLLCTSCNNYIVARLESKVKADPRIRMALESLKGQLPDIYGSMQKRLKWVGKGSDGSVVRAVQRGKGLQVLGGKGEGGSLILDTSEAEQAIRKKLQKAGVEELQIEKWLGRIDDLSEKESVSLPHTGWKVTKPSVKLFPELSTDDMMDDRLPASKALEFVSLLVGKAIYDQSFDPLRNYILGDEPNERFSVDHLSSEKYDTFHGMDLTRRERAFFVHLRLFRWLVFRVAFHRFDYRGYGAIYEENLLTKQTYFSLLPEALADLTRPPSFSMVKEGD